MPETTPAAVVAEFGRIEMRELPLPEIGKEDALLQMEAVGICGTDWKYYSGAAASYLPPPPHLLGHENVGRVARVGAEGQRRWNVHEGDRVLIESLIPCWACDLCTRGRYNLCRSFFSYGLMSSVSNAPHLWGGFAGHLYVHPRAILHKIADHVPATSATFFVALANGFRWATRVPGLRAGQTVLVQGPGQQGLGSVIAAREAGAGLIVATGLSQDAARLDLARAVGADAVIVSDQEDVEARLAELTGGQMANVVVECSGNPAAQAQTLQLAAVGGTIVFGGTAPGQVSGTRLYDVTRKELTIRGVFTHLYEDVEDAIRVLEGGRYPLDLLSTHTFPLAEADHALRLVGRQVEGENPLHVSLFP